MAKSASLNETVHALLQANRGIFFGESHDSDFTANYIINNLKDLKAHGVTTIYVEYSPQKVVAAQGGDACREHYIGLKSGEKIYSTSQSVIEEATAIGMRVIGYDPVVGTLKSIGPSANSANANALLIQQADIASPTNMDKRDIFGIKVIESTKDGGKFIVYGGMAHSGNDPDDSPHASGIGIDQRLGIPSIDFYDHVGKGSGLNNVRDTQIVQDRFGSSTYDARNLENYFRIKNVPSKTPEGAALLEKLKKQNITQGLCNTPATNKVFWDMEDVAHSLPISTKSKSEISKTK